EIVNAVHNATGRELAIDGDISLSLLPAPALSAGDLRLGNPAGHGAGHGAGQGAADMARLKRLDVRVAFWPLLSGNVEVTSVRLVEPHIHLQVFADGSNNWSFGPAPSARSGPGEAKPAAGGGGAEGHFTFERFEVDGGELVYSDARSGVERRLERIDLRGSAASLKGPFKVSGSLAADGIPLGFEVDAGTVSAGRPTRLRTRLTLPDGKAAAEFTGSFARAQGGPALAGSLTLQADDLSTALAAAGAGTSPALARPLAVEGKLTGSAQEVALNDLHLTSGDLRADGAVSLAFGATPSFDVALSAGRLDLDRLLHGTAQGKGAAAGKSGSAGTGTSGAGGVTAFAIPKGVNGSVSLTVDGISYRGGVIRQAQLGLALSDGKLTLSRASAQLPGGSDASLSGRVVTDDKGPRFDGRLEMLSDNLRGLLNWLDVDVGAVPAGRLASLVVTADVSATPDLVQVGNANIRLDAATITGGGAIRVQSRPSFGVALSVDRLNLDGYLPENTGSAEAAQAKGKAGAKPPAGGQASPLALLDDFDSNLSLRVGQLTVNGVDLRGLDADLGLVHGDLTIRKAAVADVTGSAFSLSGTAKGFDKQPQVDLRLQATAKDMAALSQLAGLEASSLPAGLAGSRLDASVKGTMAALKLDATARSADTALSLQGEVAKLPGPPEVDLRYRLANPSFAALARSAGLGLAPEREADGPIELSGGLKGGLAALQATAKLALAGGSAEAEGRIEHLDAGPNLQADFKASGDLLRTLRGLGVAYRPAVQNPGGYEVGGTLSGDADALQLDGLKGKLGPVGFQGKGGVRLSGPRPLVTADLKTSEIIVDMLLPREGSASAGGSGGGGGQGSGHKSGQGDPRWSREPIDLGVLSDFDADVKLAAAGLVYGKFPFKQPTLAMQLRDGVLKVEELSGQLFGGQFGLQGTLKSVPVPALGVGIGLKGAALKPALAAAAGLDAVSGTFDFEGSFSTAGASQWDLVNALDGKATVNARDGAVRGFDMKGLSARLGELDRPIDYLDLLQRSFAGGETALKSASGHWTVKNGIARTEDTKAELEASEASLRGSVDLPSWQMDLRAELGLTEHPKAPGLGVELSGPLDAPRHDLKTKAIERWLAARLGSTLIRKGLGGKTGSGQQEKREPTPQEAIDNILKGLLKEKK
ncbi:MAG TPA: AsmA family protein, partial [Alphaproteobacteria bacterium]|nr:AsmA family protein [Alphaproteobacteria bacterium]